MAKKHVKRIGFAIGALSVLAAFLLLLFSAGSSTYSASPALDNDYTKSGTPTGGKDVVSLELAVTNVDPNSSAFGIIATPRLAGSYGSVLGNGSGKYKYIGNQPFEVTNWEAPLTQTVLTAAIAKYPKIDVIMSDFGPVMVSSLGEFTKSGRSIPALATSDGNILGCFFQDNVKKNKDFKLMTVATGTDHVVLAVQHAVARATGGVIPKETVFKAPVFEDSVTSKPRGVQCDREIGDWTFLSSQMSGKQQEVFLNK